MNQPKREKREINGWVVLDKPLGMTSTTAVAAVRRIFKAKKAGHAGHARPARHRRAADRTWRSDQDRAVSCRTAERFIASPSASGSRPIPTTPKAKRLRVPKSGRRGKKFWRCCRPSPARSCKRRPQFSALKVDGERAYDLARGGETVELAAREIEIDSFSLIALPDADHAEFEIECGKGTYVRSLARDIGRKLGCLGHVSRASPHAGRRFRGKRTPSISCSSNRRAPTKQHFMRCCSRSPPVSSRFPP